jgi:hypothetical protein
VIMHIISSMHIGYVKYYVISYKKLKHLQVYVPVTFLKPPSSDKKKDCISFSKGLWILLFNITKFKALWFPKG